MKTERLAAGRRGDLERAAELLRAGGTVAFPTETVYGLGANALSAAAVEKIFAAKQRPRWDPLIVHVADRAAVAQVAASDKLSDRLMDAFWPGPLTLLLPRTAAVPDRVTAGRPLVGLRIPALEVTRELLRLAGIPVAAPSANRFGHTSPTTAEHVLDDLDGRIDAVLDGGATTVGVESTVAEVQGSEVVIYRAGAVTADMLAEIAGVESVKSFNGAQAAVDGAPAESLPSPGVGIRHYAPRARVVLVSGAPECARTDLLRELAEAAAEGLKTGVMLPDGWNAGPAASTFNWGAWADPATLAQRLFAGLRALDDAGSEVIVCPLPGSGGLGDALRDRLQKAARQQ